MKKVLLALATLFAVLAPGLASAQTVTQMPAFVAPRAVLDLGNGPLEIMPLTGSAGIFTSSSTSVSTAGTSGSPNLTVALNLSPAPLVGGAVSGTGVAAGSTVVSYTAGTGVIVLSANLAANASGTYAFGTACPVSTQAAPVQPPVAMAFVQAGTSDVLQGIPFYTTARLCAYGATGPGMQFVSFPQGAH